MVEHPLPTPFSAVLPSFLQVRGPSDGRPFAPFAPSFGEDTRLALVGLFGDGRKNVVSWSQCRDAQDGLLPMLFLLRLLESRIAG